MIESLVFMMPNCIFSSFQNNPVQSLVIFLVSMTKCLVCYDNKGFIPACNLFRCPRLFRIPLL